MRRPECIELLPDRRARPPRPGAGGRVSGPRRRAMGYRRGADLGPRRGRGGPPPSGVTTEWPAVRVDARGGEGRRTGVPIRSLCLTQRRELRGRVHGRAHQLAERALLRAACGRRGEHVFGRLRLGSDGTPTLRGSVCGSARIWLWIAQSDRRFLQAILQPAGREDPVGDALVGPPRRSGGNLRPPTMIGGDRWAAERIPARGRPGGRGGAQTQTASGRRAMTRRRPSCGPSRRRRR